ncbi:permease prefix domain 1-containing protein [Lysinibacillus sp. FSL L8-0312]|uniref:permease prefix domain 1-containing protein n=1 Tax=Lysinibacillus sp. FSL L8-0312 TaxID=2921521 RepID=UPI0030F683EA
MKQIDKYVNSVYQNASGDKKAIEELKLEMKNHLLEAVSELKESGRTEQEAINIAIERFGEEKEMRSIVSQLFKVQKAFAKWVLYIGIALLLLSAVVFAYFLNIGNERTSEQSIISYEIGDLIEDDTKLTKLTEEKIKTLLSKASYIKKMNVYLNEDRETSVYNLDKDINHTFSLVYSDLHYGSDNSFVEIKVLDYRNIGFLAMLFGLTCFGVLFFIWAIINVYHKRKSHNAI